jgi:NADH-quinone oxidoreductase subunit N
MNLILTWPEIAVVALGLGLLLADLWTPAQRKQGLGYVAMAVLGLILAGTFMFHPVEPQFAFGGMFVLDGLALFFKRFFLVAGLLLLAMSIEYVRHFESGITEYYALVLFALAGMMWASSANDFSLLFVSVELITVTFYVLTSFERSRVGSLEAGVKYLILGAAASAILVYGIALVYGSSGTMSFARPTAARAVETPAVLRLGLLLVLVGLGFKISAFPMQMWVPDVYQGSPSPTTAFLAVGSKAAGFVLLLRVLFGAAPELAQLGRPLLMAVAGVTILYGNLCAIPQRNLKRLLGYSSIAHAGYLLLGVSAMSADGAAAVLYYLGGYLFALLAAFTVMVLVLGGTESEEINGLAGLHQRSPFLAATMTLAMISLAGIPPLAGFFGKFLLLKSVLAQGPSHSGYYWLAAVALVGILISLYYYFGVVRAIYWSKAPEATAPVVIPRTLKFACSLCIAGMLYVGLMPNALMGWAAQAVKVLHLP